MHGSENDTPSYRAEQGKAADEGTRVAPSSLSLGSMIRGPIGREGAPADDSGSESADADARAAEARREGESESR